MTATPSTDLGVDEQGVRGRRSAPAVIDCDVHNEFRDYRQEVVGYLDPEWRHYITNRGFNGLSMRPYTLWMGPDRHDTSREDGTAGARTGTS